MSGVVSGSRMTFKQVKSVFALAVDDFIKGSISSDNLAAISHSLWKCLLKRSIPSKYEELFKILIAGSELSYYARKVEVLDGFCGLLRRVIRYRENLR